MEAIDGIVKVSTYITDDEGNLIAELVRNEWKVAPPPRTWDRNYSKDALEVRDGKGAVILQVRAFSDQIQIQGIWRTSIGVNKNVRLMIWKDPAKDGAAIQIFPHNFIGGIPSIRPCLNILAIAIWENLRIRNECSASFLSPPIVSVSIGN